MGLSDRLNEADSSSYPGWNKVSHPNGWEPGVKFDSETGVPSEVTSPPVPELAAGNYEAVLESMNIQLPEGFELKLVEAKFDPAAWHRDQPWVEHPETGKITRPSAVTRPVWRYRFRVEKASVFTELDLPSLYAEIALQEEAKSNRAEEEIVELKDVTMVISWADIQTGKTDSLGGMKELLERLEEKRQKLRIRLDEVRPDHIIIADAGDILEGQENVLSQMSTNGLSLMDQVDVAATELQKVIALANEFTSTVDVLSVPSNHCQARRGKSLTGTPHDDWGLHINKRLEELNSYLNPDTRFIRSVDWDESLVFPVRNTSLALVHGHQANNSNGVINWWTKQVHQGRVNADILLSGHFHYFTARPSGRNPDTGKARWWLQSPTLDNGSAWVANKMGEDGDPGLLTFLIDDEGFSMQGLAIL